MSFGISAAGWAMIGVAVAGAGAYTSNQNQKKSLKQQEKAQQQSLKQAQAQEAAADQANNAANMKSPDVGGLLALAESGNRGGQSSTMLTGPAGIDTKKLSLGRTNLLGS